MTDDFFVLTLTVSTSETDAPAASVRADDWPGLSVPKSTLTAPCAAEFAQLRWSSRFGRRRLSRYRAKVCGAGATTHSKVWCRADE